MAYETTLKWAPLVHVIKNAYYNSELAIVE